MAEGPSALRAAVGTLVGVDAELVPPEVRHLFESLATVDAGVGLDGRRRVGRGLLGGRRCARRVEVLRVSLEEGLRREGQRTLGAQEDMGGCRQTALCNSKQRDCDVK